MSGSNSVKIVTNPSGIYALLKSAPVAALVNEYGQAAANRAGSHFKAVPGATSQRAKVVIKPADAAGIRENKENNTLLKALR